MLDEILNNVTASDEISDLNNGSEGDSSLNLEEIVDIDADTPLLVKSAAEGFKRMIEILMIESLAKTGETAETFGLSHDELLADVFSTVAPMMRSVWNPALSTAQFDMPTLSLTIEQHLQTLRETMKSAIEATTHLPKQVQKDVRSSLFSALRKGAASVASISKYVADSLKSTAIH